MSDLRDWLRANNLEQYAAAFEANDIDVDILPERFTGLIDVIKRDFELVHFHANNQGGLAPFHFPNAPEITFLNKRCFDAVPTPSLKTYPVAGLDAPNQPRFPDYKIEF